MRTPSVKNLKFILKYVFRYSLSPPENPILIQGHPLEIFSVTLNRDHFVYEYIILYYFPKNIIEQIYRDTYNGPNKKYNN